MRGQAQPSVTSCDTKLLLKFRREAVQLHSYISAAAAAQLLPSSPTMSQYRDPYTEQQRGGYNLQHGDPSYNDRQPHQAYDQGGFDPYTTGEYRDDPNANPQVSHGATPYAPAAQEVDPHGQSGFAKEIGQ